ncbi:Kynurenine/alpha-aminoadipate aminotransferase, mitochondrial [Armadillidium nasatum]|uniref:Kynurenine/alpha-aminoadipate aminotransferase, mitochondrial n=1 Tax=Armadillidium nasatum TaxID=96803 RepID=A0A5N5SPI9_9CRUS|nr:Kynurenine/alpha-aminoadipate aminotransferase, mitochondrial [Armadillidium nasatum]
MVYLAGGLPNPLSFPFAKAFFKLKNGKSLFIDQEMMSKALQYGSVQGFEPLICQLKTAIRKFHGISDLETSNIVITPGGTDALYQCLEMLFDENTFVLAETPLFGSVTQCIEVYGCKYVAIPRDNFGMKPFALKEEVLKILKTLKGNEKMILYLNYISVKRDEDHILLERLKNIYEIAQEFNIFIVEVDPHFLIHLHKKEKSPASLLRLDKDERVLRCDTISSLFGPGWRVGFVTGPKPFIQLIGSHIDMSMLSASMLSQVLISETLRCLTEEEQSEYSKLLHENLRNEQRDLKAAAQRYLGKNKQCNLLFLILQLMRCYFNILWRFQFPKVYTINQ